MHSYQHLLFLPLCPNIIHLIQTQKYNYYIRQILLLGNSSNKKALKLEVIHIIKPNKQPILIILDPNTVSTLHSLERSSNISILTKLVSSKIIAMNYPCYGNVGFIL